MFETDAVPIVRDVDPPIPVWVRARWPGHEDIGVRGLLHRWVGLVDWGSRVWRAHVIVDPADVPPGVMHPGPRVPATEVLRPRPGDGW